MKALRIKDMDDSLSRLETSPDAPRAPRTACACAAAYSTRDDLRDLFRLAVPSVTSALSETLLNFVDFAIVSFLGAQAQAAVTSGSMVFFCAFSFLLGMMICVTTMVSQSLGAGRPRDCAVYAWQAIFLCLLFGLGGILAWPVIPHLFAAIGHEPAVQAMEVDFTRIRLCALAFAGMAMALGNFFNGIHQPRINAQTVVVCVLLNAGLSYILVLGKCGLPAMGVTGAALGTLIASGVRVSWLLAAMCWARSTAVFEARKALALDWDKLGRLTRVGWPSGMAFALDIAAWTILFVLIVGGFGTKPLAAMATCWRYIELSFMPAVGIGIAVSTMVGRSIGQGRFDLARRRAGVGVMVNLAYMGTMALIFLFFGRTLMGWFSHDAEVIAIGARLLVLAAIFQAFDALAITYGDALRGAGDTTWLAITTGTASWTLTVGGASLIAHFRPEWGAVGPFASATLFVIVVGIACSLRWRGGAWERLDVIGRSSPAETAVFAAPAEARRETADGQAGLPRAGPEAKSA